MWSVLTPGSGTSFWNKGPTAREFLDESRQFLTKNKAKVVKVYTPARLRNDPPLDGFAFEVELGKQKMWLDYYVTSQVNGGVTVGSARLTTISICCALATIGC